MEQLLPSDAADAHAAPAAAFRPAAPGAPAASTAALRPRRLEVDELSAIALGRGADTMPLWKLYFVITGRIPRRTFWLHGVLALLGAAIVLDALVDIAGFDSDRSGRYVNLVLAWPVIAVSGKRLHDYNRSAWWMLVNLVPGIGSFVMLMFNGLMRGRRGPNRFGADPSEWRPARVQRALDDHALRAVNTGH